MSLKEKIKKLLEHNNHTELVEVAKKGDNIFRYLISMAYNKEDLICWRAIESVGRIAAVLVKTDPELIRNVVQRLLWSIREESGGIGWSAPEMLGEIVRNCPDEFSDIVPIIASFHNEKMLRQGVFRALERISEVRPDLVMPSYALIEPYLKSDDVLVRAYVMMLAGKLRLKQCIPEIEKFLNDKNVIKVYNEGVFKVFAVRHIAEQTVILLKEEN